MKKSKLLIVTGLLLAPIMIFTGCEDPKYFSITASTSNGNIGSVSGGNNSWVEGAEISLVATSRNENVNPFICWVKDYSTVYSFDATTKITVSEETKGNYTALFQETTAASATYAAITNLICNNSDFSNIEYNIYSAPVNNTSQSRHFTFGTITLDGETKNPTLPVFNLYDKSSPIGYEFTVELKITNFSGSSIINSSFNFTIYPNQFDSNTGKFSFTDSNTNTTVNFEKITNKTYENIKNP